MSVQRESEQFANEGTSVNEGWKVVSIHFCAFYWHFLVCVKYSATCVQVTVLLEIGFQFHKNSRYLNFTGVKSLIRGVTFDL